MASGSPSEALVDALLVALGHLWQGLLHKAVELEARDDVLRVDYELEVDTESSVSGYVDAAFTDGSAVAWFVWLVRREPGWEIRRRLTVFPIGGRDMIDDIDRHLPDVACADSAELAETLPLLTDEVLGIPVPSDRSIPR